MLNYLQVLVQLRAPRLLYAMPANTISENGNILLNAERKCKWLLDVKMPEKSTKKILLNLERDCKGDLHQDIWIPYYGLCWNFL